MTYSQPDPADETTTDEAPEEPDTEAEDHEARDTSDDTEGGGQR